MLALTRKPGQEIIIDDGAIRIVVIEIDRNHVVLGFEAKRETIIHRKEVWELIQRGKTAAGPDTERGPQS